jgi:toxin ParE1/3/4
MLDYLEQQGEPAVRRVAGDIERTIEILARRPMGRPGRVSGTYEKLVIGQPYIVVYALTPSGDGEEDNLIVMRVVHLARLASRAMAAMSYDS